MEQNTDRPLPPPGTMVLPPVDSKNMIDCLEESDQVGTWVVKLAEVDGCWRARPKSLVGGLVCFVKWADWGPHAKSEVIPALRILRHGSKGTVVFAEIVWPENNFGKGVFN